MTPDNFLFIIAFGGLLYICYQRFVKEHTDRYLQKLVFKIKRD